MKLYLDTEFIEDGRTIDLVSVALVSENGQEFYRQNSQADFRNANDFVIENVVPRLWPCPKKIPAQRHIYGLCPDKTCVWRPKRLIRDELLKWVRETCGSANYAELSDVGDRPEFWAYYADYDWVVLCQLFGRMIDLPTGWPMYCRDIKQYADYLGNPTLPKGTDEHNSLSDARWVCEAHRWLQLYDLSLSRYERENIILARRKESRTVDQEPQGVRSPEGEVRGHPGGKDPGGEDIQRGGSGPEEVVRVGQEAEVAPYGQEGSPVQ